jgi:hypothetical protein
MLTVCKCVNTIGLTSGSCSPTLHAIWQKPEDLWALHSLSVFARPHSKQSKSWAAVNKVKTKGQNLGLKDFRPIKPLGCGDTGR